MLNLETETSPQPAGTRPGEMYGLCKVHKDVFDNCSPVYLFYLQFMLPTYKITKLWNKSFLWEV